MSPSLIKYQSLKVLLITSSNLRWTVWYIFFKLGYQFWRILLNPWIVEGSKEIEIQPCLLSDCTSCFSSKWLNWIQPSVSELRCETTYKSREAWCAYLSHSFIDKNSGGRYWDVNLIYQESSEKMMAWFSLSTFPDCKKSGALRKPLLISSCTSMYISQKITMPHPSQPDMYSTLGSSLSFTISLRLPVQVKFLHCGKLL